MEQAWKAQKSEAKATPTLVPFGRDTQPNALLPALHIPPVAKPTHAVWPNFAPRIPIHQAQLLRGWAIGTWVWWPRGAGGSAVDAGFCKPPGYPRLLTRLKHYRLGIRVSSLASNSDKRGTTVPAAVLHCVIVMPVPSPTNGQQRPPTVPQP